MHEAASQILFHLDRSMAAYKLYSVEKKYFQALRIYKANKMIYSLIIKNANLWRENNNLIIEYLFHLEDWFEQFKNLRESVNPGLTSEFIFTRLENSPAFPSDIYQFIKSKAVQ